MVGNWIVKRCLHPLRLSHFHLGLVLQVWQVVHNMSFYSSVNILSKYYRTIEMKVYDSPILNKRENKMGYNMDLLSIVL